MNYDMIDRFLRNNLSDEDYAEYSAALDALCTPQRKPLTDDQIAEFAERMEASDPTDSFWREFARAIEAAHGITGETQ